MSRQRYTPEFKDEEKPDIDIYLKHLERVAGYLGKAEKASALFVRGKELLIGLGVSGSFLG